MQLIFNQDSFSQTNCFTPATHGDLGVNYGSIPPSPNVTHTGNDMRKGIASGNTSTSMRVQVWDGDYPGIYGYDGGTQYGTLLPDGITDPDVVLMERSSYPYWYALIVYADGNGKCVFDLYKWDGYSFSPVNGSIYPYVLRNSNNEDAEYSTAINIDMDENGNFCIVWDDAQSGNIMAQGGYVYNDEPVLCGSPTSKVIADDSYYKMPDVSLIRRSCSLVYPNTCYSKVFITYVDTDIPNVLHVDGDDFEDWICGGGTIHFLPNSFSIPTGSPLSSFFLFPRIACPLFDNSGHPEEWTAVVEVYDPGNGYDDIVGYNDISGSITSNIFYTDASRFINSCPINKNNDERNKFPVVSYDSNYNGIMIGWESEYSSSNLAPKGVIALTCGVNALQNSNSCFDDYLIISNDNGVFYHTSNLSLSGRDFSNEIIYSFYGDDSFVYFKNVAFPSCTLRKRNVSIENKIFIFPNPFTNKLTISLTNNSENIQLSLRDILGNNLINFSGKEMEINNALNKIIPKLPIGTYSVRMQFENTEIVNKIIIKI